MTCLIWHKWLGCKCIRCGAERNTHHDWDLCTGKCRLCGKKRSIQHNWSGCKCSLCGITRDEKHNWRGCKCPLCGKTRDERHIWNGCKCTSCGMVRDVGHIFAEWDDFPHYTTGHCKVCGKKCEHEWVGCTCRICGVSNGEHELNQCGKCSFCNRLIHDDHKWERCICLVCGEREDKHSSKHDWQPGANSCTTQCSICGMVMEDSKQHKWEASLKHAA